MGKIGEKIKMDCKLSLFLNISLNFLDWESLPKLKDMGRNFRRVISLISASLLTFVVALGGICEHRAAVGPHVVPVD